MQIWITALPRGMLGSYFLLCQVSVTTSLHLNRPSKTSHMDSLLCSEQCCILVGFKLGQYFSLKKKKLYMRAYLVMEKYCIHVLPVFFKRK